VSFLYLEKSEWRGKGRIRTDNASNEKRGEWTEESQDSSQFATTLKRGKQIKNANDPTISETQHTGEMPVFAYGRREEADVVDGGSGWPLELGITGSHFESKLKTGVRVPKMTLNPASPAQ